jgi:hypothetical protein
MKRFIFIAVVATSLVAGGIIICLFRSPTSPSDVSISFLGYTNDVVGYRNGVDDVEHRSGYRADFYGIFGSEESSMTIFQVANRSRHAFAYRPRGVELRYTDGWRHDTNNLPMPHSAALVLESGSTHILLFPNPPGSLPIRCCIRFAELRVRPRWQCEAIHVLRKVGLHVREREFIVTSPEIVR